MSPACCDRSATRHPPPCSSIRPGGRATCRTIEAWARVWQTWTCAAFLKGYFATAGDALFIPTEPSQRDALLQLFMLAKALYELNYELNNRPDWLRIPLSGVLEIVEAD